MGPRHDLSFCACKTAWLASELLVFMSPSPLVWFLDAKERLLDRINKSLWVPDITCLLCMQNTVISNWITSLSGSQPSSVVFACKTAAFGPEIQISMGPRPHLSFCACKTAWFAPEWQVYMGSSPHLWFCACKEATLGPDLQVCMGPRPHLWFWTHITACLPQEWIGYTGSSPHLWFCACKTATLGLELQVSLGPRPHLWFLHAKQRLLDQNNMSLWVPEMTCRFVLAKQPD